MTIYAKSGQAHSSTRRPSPESYDITIDANDSLSSLITQFMVDKCSICHADARRYSKHRSPRLPLS